jgi:hypothetical protein
MDKVACCLERGAAMNSEGKAGGAVRVKLSMWAVTESRPKVANSPTGKTVCLGEWGYKFRSVPCWAVSPKRG